MMDTDLNFDKLNFQNNLDSDIEEAMAAKVTAPNTNQSGASVKDKASEQSDIGLNSKSEITHFGLFDDDDENEELEDFTLPSGGQGSKVADPVTVQTAKSKVEGKSQSAVEMEAILEQISEPGSDQSLKNSLNEVDHDRYQLVVEKTSDKSEEDDFCCICRDEHDNPKVLEKCSHKFCTGCIDTYFRIKPVCPVCFVAYGVITGNQPQGHMSDSVSKKIHLPGYETYDTIIIHYAFGNGIQTAEHPKPGQPYYGTSRTAYLPSNPEGQKVLKLLKEAFNRRLTFTVGHSRTTGCDDVVTWNDIHHKTCTHGGQENFGYPDATYLQRVQQELAAFGVTEENIARTQTSGK